MNLNIGGINSARMRMDAAATNLSRMNTPNATSIRVSEATGPNGKGVEGRYQMTDQPIEPAREMVDLIQSEHALKANARFIQCSSETYKSIIDILA